LSFVLIMEQIENKMLDDIKHHQALRLNVVLCCPLHVKNGRTFSRDHVLLEKWNVEPR
jgi:hypothetical protein